MKEETEKAKNKKILKLLYRSFDSVLDGKEQRILDEALKNSGELRKEKGMIALRRRAITESGAASFKPFFTERVMNRIEAVIGKNDTLVYFYESLKMAFKRYAIIVAIVMLAIIIYNFGIGDSLASGEIYYISDLTLEKLLDLPLF